MSTKIKKKVQLQIIYKVSLKLKMKRWTQSSIKSAGTILLLSLGPADKSMAIPELNRNIQKKCELSGEWRKHLFWDFLIWCWNQQ